MLKLEYSTDVKISAAEGMWLIKVAENDLALSHCDNTLALLQRMFPDSKICLGFTMSCQKTSYIFQIGHEPFEPQALLLSL